jgi:RimJ/RimL family protein N-acetyltransferase
MGGGGTTPGSTSREPTIETKRLLLRTFMLDDAVRVRELASAREVAATTLNIPHPYEAGDAETWIATQPESFQAGEAVHYAITRKQEADLIGAIGLQLQDAHRRAELGYWIGVPYWNQGYCTEAAAAVVNFGFEQLGLHRVFAHHFSSNPASGRVMQKVGMLHEGRLRGHVLKWGNFHDLEIYGLTRVDD